MAQHLSLFHFKQLKFYETVHILYVSKHYDAGVMKKLENSPVLLVGEGFECWQQNFHICLFKEGKQYRLKVDPMSFDGSGLVLHPELIELLTTRPDK